MILRPKFPNRSGPPRRPGELLFGVTPRQAEELEAMKMETPVYLFGKLQGPPIRRPSTVFITGPEIQAAQDAWVAAGHRLTGCQECLGRLPAGTLCLVCGRR